jgi:hypothetical protein
MCRVVRGLAHALHKSAAMSKTQRNPKLQIKKLTLRKLTPVEAGEIYGGACCASLACKTDNGCDLAPITKNPGHFGQGWTLSVSFTLGPSKFGVSVSASYSWGWTG